MLASDESSLQTGTLTAIGIDKDKNSQQALKWTVDHLVDNQTVILVHVRSKSPTHGFAMAEATPEATKQQIEMENNQLFLPYRGFCSRKGIEVKEVVLEDSDVPKAISEYIATQHIHNIVVGASTRKSLTKKFRHMDVAASLMKYAPGFCAVYVISKGKPINVRSARTAIQASVPPNSFVDEPTKKKEVKKMTPVASSSDRMIIQPINSISKPESMDFDQGVSNIFNGGGEYSFNSVSVTSDKDDSSNHHKSKHDMEAEMKRLKLELKQTMEMYSNACKEAITAKQMAKDLAKQNIKESKATEDAAIPTAEMEKAKGKAAVETAEIAQRTAEAEAEAEKRKHAEHKAKHKTEEKHKAVGSSALNDIRYRKYNIEDIEFATERFAKSNKIGEGGYGPVYRGCLDHTPVAIKILRPDAAQGRKQFNQEVEVLSCIRHPNMVLLLGACPEYGALVYEYMDNGSLEDRLTRLGHTPPIPWWARFRISAEIATALLFLHQTKPEPLVHRDLKPANILLDRNYTSKISDVGLARLVPPSVSNAVTQYHMTSAAGTFCYIDPEYQQTGLLGCKSDIYSLGVMLLQIITAKPPMGLTHQVARAIEKGNFEEVLDQSVKDWPVKECLRFAKLALKCAELRKKDRPDLGSVILPELNRLRNIGYEYENRQFAGSAVLYSSGDSSRSDSSDKFSLDSTSL